MAKGFSVFVNIGAKLLPSLNSSATRVEQRFSKMGRRMKIVAAETKMAYRDMAAAAAPMLALAASGGLFIGVKDILGASSDYAHQTSQLHLAGRSAKEMAKATAAAYRTIVDVPTSKMADNLAMLNETTLAFGSFEHALENLSFNQKIESLLNNQFGAGFVTPNLFNDLIKSIELRGGKVTTAEYQKLATGMYKAISASGGKITPEQYLGFTQQASPYMRAYSDDFFTQYAPSVIQEMGGDRAGTALAAFGRQIMGKVRMGGKGLVGNWKKLGLLRKGAKNGDNLSSTGWNPQDVVGYRLAQSNPLAWFEQVMIPRLEKHGIKMSDPSDVTRIAALLFGRETGARLASTFLDPKQRARMHADQKFYEGTMGPNEAYKWALSNDPKMAWKAIGASMNYLALELGKIFTKPSVIKGILAFARFIARVADFFGNHGTLGAITTGIMGAGGVAGLLTLFGGGGLVKAAGKGFGRLVLWIATAGGRLIFSAFARLAPWIIRGLIVAFAAIAGLPIWATVLIGVAVAAGGALIWHFREKILSGLRAAGSWFMSVNWGAIGLKIAMAIANALTNGLAGRIPATIRGAVGWWGAHAPTWAGGAKTPAPAKVPGGGHRAMGGPVRAGHWYWVNERGQEAFIPGRSGTVIPHSEMQRRRAAKGGVHIGAINVNGAQDPEMTARAVRAEIERMASAQSGYLND